MPKYTHVYLGIDCPEYLGRKLSIWRWDDSGDETVAWCDLGDGLLLSFHADELAPLHTFLICPHCGVIGSYLVMVDHVAEQHLQPAERQHHLLGEHRLAMVELLSLSYAYLCERVREAKADEASGLNDLGLAAQVAYLSGRSRAEIEEFIRRWGLETDVQT